MSSDLLEQADREGRLDWSTRLALRGARTLGLHFEDATRPAIEARVAELRRELDPADPADRDRLVEIKAARRWALDLHWRFRLWQERQPNDLENGRSVANGDAAG